MIFTDVVTPTACMALNWRRRRVVDARLGRARIDRRARQDQPRDFPREAGGVCGGEPAALAQSDERRAAAEIIDRQIQVAQIGIDSVVSQSRRSPTSRRSKRRNPDRLRPESAPGCVQERNRRWRRRERKGATISAGGTSARAVPRRSRSSIVASSMRTPPSTGKVDRSMASA